MEPIGIVFLVFIILFDIIGIPCLIIRAKKKQEEQIRINNLINSLFSYHRGNYPEKDYVLTLKRRDPAIKSFIKIVPDKEATIGYEPTKIHYGSATTGGYTVGGVYTTGDYNYVKDIKKNGKYRLETYKGQQIQIIQLDHDMYLKAKTSYIEKYLNDEEQIVVVPPADESDVLIFQMTGRISNDRYPDYDKCIEILKWISTAEN